MEHPHPPVANLDRRTLVVARHHSPSDWSYQSGGQFYLDGSQYVTATPSLASPAVNRTNSIAICSLKPAISSNIQGGRATWWHRYMSQAYDNFEMYVLAQTEPYLGTPANCYRLDVNAPNAVIQRRVSGNPTWSATLRNDIPTGINTWRRYRFTWFSWLNDPLNPTLRFSLDRWDGSQWLTGTNYDDVAPAHTGTGTAYFGFGLWGYQTTLRQYTDDLLLEERAV